MVAKEKKESEEEVDESGVYQVSAPDLAFGERGPYGSFGVRR